MLTSRTKLIFIVSLLAFSLGILVGMNIKMLGRQVESNGTQHARKTIRLTIERSQWDKLFEQLQKFADKWRYAIRIAPLDPNGNSFNVEMWRADMRLTAFADTNFDAGAVQIHFYDTDPTRPVPITYIDEEIRDLKSFLNEIPNVTITEE